MCHRTVSGAPGQYTSELATFGFLQRHSAIIHRPPDCPVHQRSNGYQRNDRLQRYSARTVRAEVRAAARGALDSEQYLSGTAPDCPVPLEDKAPAVKS
jgi:hypothetical protein